VTDIRRAVLLTAVVLFAAAVFITDLLTPLGVAEWVLYLPVILAPVWFNNSRQVVVASALCSALVVVGFFLSPPGILHSWDLINRGMGLTALWLTALAGITICRRSTRLAEVMLSLQREIAQHQQTEQALGQSEERLRLAVEGAGMGTWDLDLRTGKRVWSETNFRMLGYQPVLGGEATREMWLSRLHPDDRDRVLEVVEEARRERSLYCPEYRICRADNGETVWLAAFGRFVYDETGEAVRFLGVLFNVTRRKRAAESLRESQERLRLLQRELVEIAAQEQRRIGQELHDGVGQELTGLGLMANALAQHLRETDTEKRIADRLVAGLDRVHQQVRTLARGLVPVQLEAQGLWAALDDLAVRASEQSGIPVTFDCPEGVGVPDHAAATQLHRIAQEAVSNALRHGRPQQVRLTLLYEPDGLRLSIQDDGTGTPDQMEESNGMGFRIMQYRAEQIGGALQIGQAEGGGTIVTCKVPREARQ